MKKRLLVLLAAVTISALAALAIPLKKAYAERLCFIVQSGNTYKSVSCDDGSWYFHELAKEMLGHDLLDNKCYGQPVEIVNIVEVDINSSECQTWKAGAAQTAASPSKCYNFRDEVSVFDSYAFPADKISETPCNEEVKKEYKIREFTNGTCYVLAFNNDYRAVTCNSLTSIIANAPGNHETRENNKVGGSGSVNSGGAQACDNKPKTSFFGIPTWYEYLPVGKNCSVELDLQGRPNQIWLIALAIADILLTVAGVIAVAFIIYGGVQYILSQGEPDRTKQAKDTIINALIGLVIAILSTAIVNYIGNTLQ